MRAVGGDSVDRKADVQTARAGLEDLARSLHASYLNRWGRHDPAGLERQAADAAEQHRDQRRRRRISAA